MRSPLVAPAVSVLLAVASTACESTRSHAARLGAAGDGGSAGATGAGSGGTGGSASTPLPVGVSAQLSTTTPGTVEAEPFVALGADGVAVAIWMNLVLGEPWHLGYVVSFDGGESWSPAAKLESPGSIRAADPTVAVDAAGALHAAWLAYPPGDKTQARIIVATAPKGSTTFGPPEEITDPNARAELDKPVITLSPGGARLVSYTRPSGGIAVARSDGGGSWKHTILVADGAEAELSLPCGAPGAGGATYVTYLELGGVRLRRSDDDGATWGPVLTVSEPADGTPPLDPPTCVARGNDVWVAYGVTQEGSTVATSSRLVAIRVAHSTNGGKSVAERRAGHDAKAGAYFMHPGLALGDDGSLHLLYYAGANGSGATLRHARALPGGGFGPSVVARDGLAFITSRTSSQWTGDYLGVAVRAGVLLGAYADNGTSAAHVASYRVVIP